VAMQEETKLEFVRGRRSV